MKKSRNSKSKEKIKEQIKKLKIKIPELKKPEPEMDSLEEQIKETEEIIEDTEFHEFFQLSERSFSTALQRVEAPPQETLEANVASAPVSSQRTGNMENPMAYSANQDYSQGEKRKYQNDSVSLRRITPSQELPRQELINPFEQARNPSWGDWTDKKINIESLGEKRTSPFEKSERKYKEVRLED